jgi:integrase
LFQGKKHRSTLDRPYTRAEILKLLDAGNTRDKIIVLLMASDGLRIGVLPSVVLRDLIRIDKYNLYQLKVYAGTEAEYITFCTPETRKYIARWVWKQKEQTIYLT